MKKVFLILFCLLFVPSLSSAASSNIQVIPSVLGATMDAWQHFPRNRVPETPKLIKVHGGQQLSILILFKWYSFKDISFSYDTRLYNPKGELVSLKSNDVVVGKRSILTKRDSVLSQSSLQVVFTEKDSFGHYTIKVNARNGLTNKTIHAEANIELVPFSVGEQFVSPTEYSQWVTYYYQKPDPARSINGILQFIQCDTEWIKDNFPRLTFLRRVFLDNPYLWDNIHELFNNSTIEDKKKILLILAISGHEDKRYLTNINKELSQIYMLAKRINIPSTEEEIVTGVQLDILWGDFFATGKYEPIRKIINVLSLKEYSGTIKKVKSGELELTEDVKRKAFLDAVYQAAQWSIIANCKQHSRVFNYCIFTYDDKLDTIANKQLLGILAYIDSK